jgi:hypothetical protein
MSSKTLCPRRLLRLPISERTGRIDRAAFPPVGTIELLHDVSLASLGKRRDPRRAGAIHHAWTLAGRRPDYRSVRSLCGPSRGHGHRLYLAQDRRRTAGQETVALKTLHIGFAGSSFIGFAGSSFVLCFSPVCRCGSAGARVETSPPCPASIDPLLDHLLIEQDLDVSVGFAGSLSASPGSSASRGQVLFFVFLLPRGGSAGARVETSPPCPASIDPLLDHLLIEQDLDVFVLDPR